MIIRALALAREEESEGWKAPTHATEDAVENYSAFDQRDYHPSTPSASSSTGYKLFPHSEDPQSSFSSTQYSFSPVVPHAETTGDVWDLYDEVEGAGAGGALRQPLDRRCTTKECLVCVEEKSINHFPPYALTEQCAHTPNTCLDCVETHIRTALGSNVFHTQVITCPECRSPLNRDDIQQFADPNTFARYV